MTWRPRDPERERLHAIADLDHEDAMVADTAATRLTLLSALNAAKAQHPGWSDASSQLDWPREVRLAANAFDTAFFPYHASIKRQEQAEFRLRFLDPQNARLASRVAPPEAQNVPVPAVLTDHTSTESIMASTTESDAQQRQKSAERLQHSVRRTQGLPAHEKKAAALDGAKTGATTPKSGQADTPRDRLLASARRQGLLRAGV